MSVMQEHMLLHCTCCYSRAEQHAPTLYGQVCMKSRARLQAAEGDKISMPSRR